MDVGKFDAFRARARESDSKTLPRSFPNVSYSLSSSVSFLLLLLLRLFNFGVGLHLIEGDPPKRKKELIPEADPFSFQVGTVPLFVFHIYP